VVDWASPAVQQKFLAKRGRVNFIRACAMLWEANHVKSAAGLGYLAENIVHQYIISHSFTLTGQRLAEEAGWPEPVESKIFAFQPTTKHWFASMQELTQLVSSRSDARLCSLYLQPVQNNFPGLDSICFATGPDELGRERLWLRLLQITTAKDRHDLDLLMLQRVLLALGFEPDKGDANRFLVDILFLLKPSAFEEGFSTVQPFKFRGKQSLWQDLPLSFHAYLGHMDAA
jgi:hypothetical protein